VVTEILGFTLDDFCNWLFGIAGRPVMNKSGLTGKFKFHFEYTPDESPRDEGRSPDAYGADGSGVLLPSDPTGAASILTALEEQLGLRPVPAEALRDYLIIDGIERPSDN
jgi:uncharacterized protein (TIGR03435 family)